MKKIIALGMSIILTFTVMACGLSPTIDDQAATRGLDEGAGHVYIDDGAIALAETAVSLKSNQLKSSVNACKAVFNLMNQQRVANGLSELVWNERLKDAAQVRANESAQSFSHTRPNGSAFWTVDSGCQYGENLAKFYQSADSVYKAWMNSPSHAANMMNEDYKTVGIAIAQAVDGSWYWAQEFGY